MPSISESLTQAVAYHRAGQHSQAEQIYRQVLQADPQNADAWHLLGVIGSQVDNHEMAVQYIRRAIELNPNSAVFHANLGAAYQKLKRFDDAVACYRRALELNPNNAEAHNNLGVVLQNWGDPATAAACFRRAVKLNANYAEAHSNLGNVLQALGKPAEALAAHQVAAQLKPDYSEAQHGIGAALKELGRLDAAIAAYRRALALKEHAAETHNNLGVALKDRELLDQAVAAYRRAIELKPDYAEAHTNLGNALREQGKLDEAIACHQRAMQLKPNFAEALNNLGNALKDRAELPAAIDCFQRAQVLAPNMAEIPHSLGAALKEQGRLEEAITCYRRALELKADYADAHNSLGIGMQEQGHMVEAIACYQRALQLQPDMPEAHNNLGNLLKDDAQFTPAIACYQRALQFKADMHEAHNNLGNALKDQGRLDEAITCYQRALEIKPDFADAHSNLVFSFQYRPGMTLAGLAAAHAVFDRRHGARLRASWPSHGPRDATPRRLRLGFVSPDFCQHPVGFFLIRAVENLDRGQVEISCYSDRLAKDPLTARFQAASSLWRDVLGWNAEKLAAQIQDDRIDILFDLAGHTARNRMLVFARKPAPIQITWIGYEGTTGLSAIDYIVTDRLVVPEGAEPHYREKVLRLPDCYLCYDPPEEARSVSPPPALRNGYVTFGSCNNLAKLNEEVIATWAEILRRLPDAKLLLKYRGLEDENVRARFLGLFAAAGIPVERLEIEGWSPLSELMARHDRIDIALDPFPFAGGVTTCNALWMGVPVVTWPGETFASRHSLSYLSSVGLTETIAGSREEYVEIAARLAADLPQLAEIRAGLRPRMAASPLCDGKRFAANLLSTLQGVWRNWCETGSTLQGSDETPGSSLSGADSDRIVTRSVSEEPEKTIVTRSVSEEPGRSIEARRGHHVCMVGEEPGKTILTERVGEETSVPPRAPLAGQRNVRDSSHLGVAAAAGPRTVLHVGCGDYHPEALPPQFRGPGWKEIRLDINPAVSPDVVASITDMSAVPSGSVDAIWSSHNIEHLYAHEVPQALYEFWRVLKPGGLALIAVPDIQEVARHVAQGNLDQTLYQSPAGPICPIDVIFGHRSSIARGNPFMAHKTAFTAEALGRKLKEAGFTTVNIQIDKPAFGLLASATK
jgi:protein O-GlcNAc transferase